MKTILYNPIFINPQAYYVFPRLTRYLQPDNESTAEPANYIGTIEVKVIAYGDTTLKRTYTNTDSIDLSEFKNTWIRISLFTKVGSCVLGEWKIGNMESDLPYIDPEVLASLKAVVIVGNKTNNDSDRAIVKNLVDPDNPFVISNAAYTEGSGYADKDSPYYGAFVTDGIDDLITSTKTVQEMLGGSNEITVVSMAHFIKGESGAPEICRINQIRRDTRSIRNSISKIGKSGIFGYTYKNGVTTINNILGDKKDCTAEGNLDGIVAPFSVEGYYYNNNSNPLELCSIAWYWTIIANKVLTTDQINQVIAYFNLDRTLKPDILCNTIKQGITNENHAEFGDKLIDFSGNGRDIQLNNIAWNKESGIDDDGALRLDGVNDFGKVIDMPIYKDYTFIIDYERISYASSERWVAGVVSKSHVANQGAFILMTANTTVEPGKQAYSFGGVTSFNRDDFTRALVYQSKYKCGDVDLTVGEGVDSNTLWLGTFRDNDQRFFNGAIYSLMSFPYSMSEFLIERQLKKHKLGTLYPNMVEFRPVIKANDNYKIFYTAMLPLTGDIWERINIGDYVPVGRRIAIQMSFDNEAKKLVSAVSSQLGNITIVKNSNNIGYTIFGDVLKDKSPQKISITIEQDENYVLFNPVINSNYKYISLDFFLNNYQKKINIGDYIPKDAYLRANLYLNNNVDELAEFTFNGVSIGYSRSIAVDTAFNIGHIYNYDSPQEVNITIDEYIRYEEIVQPYPVIFQITDRNTNQRYSWGDKIKVGSSIRLSQGEKPNLLSGLYSIKSYEYEGKTYSYNQLTNLNIILTKQSISLSCNKTWLLDDNEPKCILSPRLLSIPNSSYKILGYIPDISGHGNNGVINNSAYAEGSGVNEDGSYQFDGVDDFVTIPTVTGGKQVLMKVNWQSDVGAVTLYDQRLNISDYEFAIYNGTRDLDDNPVMAYQGRNNGQTYIDGILNSNIMASELKAITHNITITNELSLGINNTYPVIGSTRSNTHFAQMSLYDFMLFDEISTDDKIKELNEYVGIEAKVELPPYYWDTYGKTNLDADKATIQQRGVAVGNYDLTNYNHAYDKMSGYGGYKFAKFDNELDWYLTPDNGYIDVVSRNGYSITLRNLSTSNYGWYFQNSTVKEFITKDIPFKVKANKSIRVYWDMHSYKSNGENFGYVVNNITLNPNEDTSINLRHLTEEELTELDANKDRMYYLLWFDLSTLAVDEEVTIEMLPLYPNGLLYDGVTDYSENVNIPTFNDFTLLVKASLLNGFIGSGGSIAKKGNNNKVIGGGYDFIYALDSSTIEDNRNSYWSFGAALRVSNGAINPPLIGYMTKNNVNGVPMSSGANPSIEGITFSKWEGYIKMVLYKAMLYPKTIPLLQINFLKNLMEKDEIIDLNNKIFI